jgi:hypothetical protein
MRKAVLVLAAAALAASPVLAKQGKGKGHGKGHDKGNSTTVVVVAPARVFRSTDRVFITDYYRANPGALPPGLAKREGLPPGLEKQLRRNGRLPPGLEKKLVAFPPAIETHLPPCPPDVRRGLIGGIAVMWNSRTGLIVDASAVLNP